jgi:hypothetical protein
MGQPKKGPGRPKIVPVGSRNAQKGSSIPKSKKTRSVPRFYEVKIRIPANDFTRGQPYFGELKHLGKFMQDAYKEKLNRAESNDKAGRLRVLANNIEILLPVITEMHKQGKLDFIFAKPEENENG